MLFENWSRQDSNISKKILLSIQDSHDEFKPDRLGYILNPVYFDDSPIGFFDGAADGGFCGIGLLLKISKDRYFKPHFAGGRR